MALSDEAAEARKLTGSADVSARLLQHVSLFVRPMTLAQFATGPLGMDDTEFERLEADFPQTVKRVCFEVLIRWHKIHFDVQVKEFIDLLVKWQKKGFISHRVWDEMGDYVRSDLLLVPIPTPAPPCGSDTEVTPSGRPFTLEDKLYIKRQLKASLRRRCRNALSTDWLPKDAARNFPLRDYYVGLKQRKKIRRAIKNDLRKELNRIHDILNVGIEDGAVNIAVIGPAGIGKSSSMAILASDWVECGNHDAGGNSKLEQFDFVFLIELRYVNDNSSLKKIIIKQHGLKGKDISESQIRSILRGRSGGKVLLMFDGYDEYQKGTNDDIDAAIENTVGDCFLILTSRDGDYISKETLDMFDGEYEIRGFSDADISKCAEKYLESEELGDNLIKKSKEAGIYDLLSTPIILLMVCVLYDKTKTLPVSITETVTKIMDMCLDRSTMKHFGKKAKDIVGLEHLLYRLGELSFKALQGKTRQLLLSKAAVMEISEDLLKLGLLHKEAGQKGWLSYPHKLFQEYWAGYYAARYASQTQTIPFDTSDESLHMWNVGKFMYGLTENPSLVGKKICWQHVEKIRMVIKEQSFLRMNSNRHLRDLQKERPDAPVNLLYNDVICCMNNYIPQPGKPSQLYFCWRNEGERLMSRETLCNTDGNKSAECVKPCMIYMYRIHAKHMHQLLQACVSTNQSVQYLYLNPDKQSEFEDSEILNSSGKRNLQLQFTDESIVIITNGDFEWLALQTVVHSIQHCTTLQKLTLLNCINVPNQLFVTLGHMSHLKHVVIEGCILPGELYVTLLQSLSCCPLKRLRFVCLLLAGAISEACKRADVKYNNLEKLEIQHAYLAEEDVLALRKLIHEDKLPKLRTLLLWGVSFHKMSDSFRKLVETCEEKLEDCEVKVLKSDLPEDFHTDQYQCLDAFEL